MEPVVCQLQRHLDEGVRVDPQFLDLCLSDVLERPPLQKDVLRRGFGAPLGGLDRPLQPRIEDPIKEFGSGKVPVTIALSLCQAITELTI